MIGAGRRDSVVRRSAGDGRSVTFLATDLLPGRPLRFWGVLAEAGADGGDNGVLIRLGILAANDGWTVRQLLAVAHARLLAEHAWSGGLAAQALVWCVERAIAAYREAQEGEPASVVAFEMSEAPSPYPWTLARCGLFALPLCPDPEGRGLGVTVAQLLLVLDLALSAWLPVTPYRRRCWEARQAVREAISLSAESPRSGGGA